MIGHLQFDGHPVLVFLIPSTLLILICPLGAQYIVLPSFAHPLHSLTPSHERQGHPPSSPDGSPPKPGADGLQGPRVHAAHAPELVHHLLLVFQVPARLLRQHPRRTKTNFSRARPKVWWLFAGGNCRVEDASGRKLTCTEGQKLGVRWGRLPLFGAFLRHEPTHRDMGHTHRHTQPCKHRVSNVYFHKQKQVRSVFSARAPNSLKGGFGQSSFTCLQGLRTVFRLLFQGQPSPVSAGQRNLASRVLSLDSCGRICLMVG